MARTYTGRAKNVSLQEQALANAQRKLDRIEKMRAEMIKQVELEMERLAEMEAAPADFASSGPTTEPPLTQSAPTNFQSQFDKFNTTPNAERLRGTNEKGTPLNFPGILTKPPDDKPSFSFASGDEHWSTLREDPGKKVYVSGYYYSSGSHTKRYEYELDSPALPISVGDMVSAPVHYQGHLDGKMLKGHDRRFIVTDIYSKNRFTPYHDVIR
jgi:hypothetical protein